MDIVTDAETPYEKEWKKTNLMDERQKNKKPMIPIGALSHFIKYLGQREMVLFFRIVSTSKQLHMTLKKVHDKK